MNLIRVITKKKKICSKVILNIKDLVLIILHKN